MKNELLLALGQLAAEKNLPREVVFEAVEAALTSAFRREGDNAPNINVKIDTSSGDIRAYRQMVVVEEVEEPAVEMTLAEARRWKPDVRVGDVLDFEEQLPPNAGRIAAQTAKQVVLQRLREAERDAVYEEYAGKEGELLVGTVQRVEARQIIIELGRGTEAVLPYGEQVRNEHLRPGQRVKVLVLEVMKAVKGPQIVVSRSHRTLLRRLFEMEVPEIKAGTVEIKSIAREGGHRSKVAVHARNPNIDPIGACVGMRGTRIQNIVNELGGERIDVIKWDPDPANFVSNALSPAQVLEVEIDPEEHLASVVVPDKMLSLAIGKEGQNARLAAKLTGWRINIRSQTSKARAEEGEVEAPLAFEPFAPGEAPDIDIIEAAEEVAAAAEAAPGVSEESAVPSPAAATAAPAAEPVAEEEEISFAAVVERMEVPDREERESEDYGEDEDEEYEIPTTVVAEMKPSAIRFAEDVLPKRPEEPEEARKPAAKKARRGPRFLEEEDDEMEDIDYSGRIH
ncbi:MAG TPA: transcription termination factor NusA [Tepidiformaceae bacterium]|jgi:N utilization substance protein A|nr:transcription termination factor NusA [Tepidiformaceae bacterium]